MFVLIIKMWKERFTLTKKNVLISFVTEANTEMKAIFDLNKILYKLSDDELAKFEAFEVLDVVE